MIIWGRGFSFPMSQHEPPNVVDSNDEDELACRDGLGNHATIKSRVLAKYIKV